MKFVHDNGAICLANSSKKVTQENEEKLAETVDLSVVSTFGILLFELILVQKACHP